MTRQLSILVLGFSCVALEVNGSVMDVSLDDLMSQVDTIVGGQVVNVMDGGFSVDGRPYDVEVGSILKDG